MGIGEKVAGGTVAAWVTFCVVGATVVSATVVGTSVVGATVVGTVVGAVVGAVVGTVVVNRLPLRLLPERITILFGMEEVLLAIISTLSTVTNTSETPVIGKSIEGFSSV